MVNLANKTGEHTLTGKKFSGSLLVHEDDSLIDVRQAILNGSYTGESNRLLADYARSDLPCAPYE